MSRLETGKTGKADGQGDDGWEGTTKSIFEMMNCGACVNREGLPGGNDGVRE